MKQSELIGKVAKKGRMTKAEAGRISGAAPKSVLIGGPFFALTRSLSMAPARAARLIFAEEKSADIL